MPTSDRENKSHTALPDIFRTINGVNLGLGPQDRFQNIDEKGAGVQWGRGHDRDGGLVPAGFPRIVLRDALGYELDTFTTLQEAIYRAKWEVKQTGQAKTPLQWRLPKAPAPARPDLTRSFPPLKHPPVETELDRLKKRLPYSNVLEFDVEDVGFVRESLQYLPYVPSLSFLRQEILCGPKTYFQIVGTMLLHKRILSLTEKRNAVYNFPGFCSGCVRLGLCYGCERSSEPHYHEDKPVKTGGGFTYFKKDRPEHEIKSKNPVNWKIHNPDQALKKMMEEFAGVDLDGELPAEIKKHLDTHGGHRERNFSQIPDFAKEMDEYNRRNQKEQDLDKQMTNEGRGFDESMLPDLDASNELEDHLSNQDHVNSRSRHKDSKSYVKFRDQLVIDSENYLYDTTDREDDDISEGRDILGGYGYPGNRHGYRLQNQRVGENVKGRSKSEETHRRKAGVSIDDGKRSSSYDRDGRRLSKPRTTPVTTSDDEKSQIRANDGDSSKSRSSRSREKLYKPPPQFKLKKSPTRRIESKSPFSTDRKFNINTGSGFQIKKSDKAPTKFKAFKNVDASWKEPKKFELKENTTKPTKFWSGQRKNKEEKRTRRVSPRARDRGRASPDRRSISPDSGLDSELMTDSTVKSELETLKEEPPIIPTPSPEPEPKIEPPKMDGEPTPLLLQVPSPDKPVSPTPPKRREIVKKEKKEQKPRTPAPKPPTPVREPTPSPSPQPPEEEPATTSREISFVFEREPVELPPIEVPALPEITEKQSSYQPRAKKEMRFIEVTPELPEPKKKLPPPPKLGPKLRPHGPSRRSKVAEAPVTSQELQQLSDPLDFLAKYCIINPERLPFYERIFNGAVSVQTPRYSRNEAPQPGAMVHLPPAVLSEHELNMLRDLTVLSHAQTPRREGISAPEQYLEKLNYTVDFIKSKQEAIQDHMQKLQGEKIHYMATLAKEMDRDIGRLEYKVKGKKKKKKKKKKVDVVDYDKVGAMSVNTKDFKPLKMSDITDEVIVSRMNDKMLKKVKKDPVVKTLTLEISRDIEKLKHFDQRVAQIEDEKDLVGLYCMDYYFSEQAASTRPHEFRRQQSRLYQKLHPDPDIEMNVEEVEMALQQINNKLLTEKEFQYIYFILDLPKRQKINFRLFSIIAALSEKVTQMDPVIRKLINKADYNALDVKMEKSKELFDLLQDRDVMPMGNAPADNLAVELTAGGLTPEHTNYVLSKFDRDGRGFCDFMDFVTYVPLFIQIHKRIIDDPFNDCLDV